MQKIELEIVALSHSMAQTHSYVVVLGEVNGLRRLPIIIGGLLYSIGAIFYALKKPGRNAKYFGFHELFHIFVLAAWVSQYLAVSIAIYRQ